MPVTVAMLDRITRVTYNIDYPDFERLFVKAGGTKNMARHLWMKWKEDHRDNFLSAYGNFDKDNRKKIVKIINKFRR